MEKKLDIFRVIVAVCGIILVIIGIWKVFGQANINQPLQKTRRMQIIEKINYANKNAVDYRLTEEDEQIIISGFAKYLEYINLAEEYKGFFKRRLNPKNNEDVLSYIVLREPDQRAWALLADFYAMLLIFEDQELSQIDSSVKKE